MARATVSTIPNASLDVSRAEQLNAEGLALARQLGDEAAEAKILWNMMLNARVNDIPQGITYGQQSLALARKLGLREQMAYKLNDLSEFYIPAAMLNEARAALAESGAFGRGLNNLPMLTDNLGRRAGIHRWVGEFEAAVT